MVTLNEFAQAFEPKLTKNIADLKEVPTTLVVEQRSGIDKEKKEYFYNVVIIDKEEYRVPDSVMIGLKVILEKKPTLTKFSVSKMGTGFSTSYQVIPLE